MQSGAEQPAGGHRNGAAPVATGLVVPEAILGDLQGQGDCAAGEGLPLPDAADLLRWHLALRARHEKLSLAYRRRVHRELRAQAAHSAILKEFAVKSMATVAGWMTAQTFVSYIDHGTSRLDLSQLASVCVGWAIYAAVISVVVPTLDWLLRDSPPANSLWRDQVQLFKACLPMMFAWAWKGLVSAVLHLRGQDFWTKLAIAGVLTCFVIVAELCPCYGRSTKAIKAKDDGDTICARILVFPGHLGLAVGFAWTTLCTHYVYIFCEKIREPLLVFMVEAVYFCLISCVLTWITMILQRRIEDGKIELAEAERVPSQDRDLWKIKHAVDFVSSTTALDAVHFVYAWGQLDVLNSFFFTYLLGCGTPTTCSSFGYQANFAFSMLLTLVAARGACALAMETRLQAWSRAGTWLATQALGLNVGWAWANFTTAAIASVTSDDSERRLPPSVMHTVCAVFAWIVISVMHRKFQVERRAWDRHVAEQEEDNFLEHHLTL